jgi:hypothetical protein
MAAPINIFPQNPQILFQEPQSSEALPHFGAKKVPQRCGTWKGEIPVPMGFASIIAQIDKP